MIPEEKNADAVRALRETFDVTEFEDIRRMTKGLSSDLVFRIVVQGSPYLLRIMTRIDERKDPCRIFACMNAAARCRSSTLRPVCQHGKRGLDHRLC